MTVLEEVADLQATVDYLKAITERADTLDFATAVAIQDEARRVKAAADELVGMIDGELIKQLEGGARELPDGRLFKRSKQYVDRHDHEPLVAAAVRQGIEAWTHPDSGQVDAERAAESAVRALAKMFLSNSSKAKVTVTDQLGIERDAFVSREFKGWKVLVIEEDPEG